MGRWQWLINCGDSENGLLVMTEHDFEDNEVQSSVIDVYKTC